MNNPPQISIIIPTYNVAPYIARALESCINQTLSDIEILVIDDCGSDDSIAIAKGFASKDSRIRIIHNKENLGTFNARIEGIKLANGEYMLFLDADDYLEKNACEVSLKTALQSLQIESQANTSLLANNSAQKTSNKHSLACCDKNVARSLRDKEIDIDSSTLSPLAHQDKQESLDLQIDSSTTESDIYRSNPTRSQRDNASQDNLPDIVFFGMRFDPPTWKRYAPPVITKPLYGDEILKAVFLDCPTPPWHIWAKLYKASHILRACALLEAYMGDLCKLNMAEDVLKSFVIIALAKHSIGIKDKLYVYCDNRSSITRRIDMDSMQKKVADLHRVIDCLDMICKSPQLQANTNLQSSKCKTQNILKATIELEYRYANKKHTSTLLGVLPQYLIATFKSLKYHRKWQTYVRIAAYILTLGKVKI